MQCKRNPFTLVLFSLLVMFFTCFMVSEAEATDPQILPPTLEWLHFVYPQGDWSYLYDNIFILNAADGGYYLVGNNKNPSGIFILKTNSTGTVEGDYTRQAPANLYLQAKSATVCSDGSIAVLARESNADSSNVEIFLLKLIFQEDALSGEMVVDPGSILTRNFDPYALYPYTGYAVSSISSTSDGGFIIGGSAFRYFTEDECETYERAGQFSYGIRYQFASPYLMRLDSGFNLKWDKVYFDNYAESLTTLDSYVDAVQPTSDGGFIVSASTYLHFFNNVNYQPGDCIFKLSAYGELQWAGFTEKNTADRYINGTNVLETREGDFLGSTYRYEEGLSRVGLFKFDANGQKIWENYFSLESGDPFGIVDLLEDGDGGYITIGTSPDPVNSTYLLKVDAAGNKLWERQGLTSELSGLANVGKGIVAATDGSIVAAGISKSPPMAVPPMATTSGGVVEDGTVITMSSATDGAVIHYTLDGTPPNPNSPTGNNVTISGDAGTIIVLKAMAIKECMAASEVAAFTYTIASPADPNQAAVPEAILSGGVVADGMGVTLISSTPDAYIKYTLDGSNPLDNPTYQSEAIITGAPGEIVTLKAVAVKDGMISSDIATYTYTIETTHNEDSHAIYIMKFGGGPKVEVATAYNNEEKTLSIEATASCAIYSGGGALTHENTISAQYQIVDAYGNPVGISGVLEWVPEIGQWRALNVNVSQVLSQAAAVEIVFEDKHNHTGSGMSEIYGDAKLGLSSYNIMPNGNVLAYATLTGINQERVTSGKANLSVGIAGSEEKCRYQLSDSGILGDLAPRDGQYSRALNIPGDTPVLMELYLENKLVDSKVLNVTATPELAVITDFAELYAEFKDTGMKDGEDQDGNGMVDYYDLLECTARYAEDYNGIVYNLEQEISPAQGYLDYSSLRYEQADDRYLMADCIDRLISAISTRKSIKNIAILGDDQVVPFFRRSDPINWEKDYYKDLQGGGETPSVIDSLAGKIMTDIPYGTFDNANPDYNKRPQLDAAVGRIFADRPAQLSEMIVAYRSPILLDNAAIFQLPKDTVDWPTQVNITLLTALTYGHTSFLQGNITDSPPFATGTYYLYDHDPTNCPYGWSPEDVTTALQNVYLNMLWSHSDHMIANTYTNPSRNLTSQDINNMEESPGHVLISTGCHSGYSIAHDSPEGKYEYYDNSLAKSLLAKQISYIAPTSYGVGYDNYVGYHDLILQRFLENMLDPSIATVGEAHKMAYREYWQRIAPAFDDRLNTYAAYGTGYYGLPTQPIDHGLGTLSRNTAAQPLSLPTTPEIQPIVIDPVFEVSDLPDGSKRFAVSGGVDTMQAFAPVMPLLIREIELPADTFVSQVSLSSYRTSKYPGEIDLTLAIPVRKSTGLLTGSYELPATYPETIYWWDTYQAGDHLKLVLCVIPMQYCQDTKIATLYEHLEFKIETSTDELWAWGANFSGQLGEGGSEDRLIPTRIGTEKDWKVVAAANNRTLALKADGTLWMWGYIDDSNEKQSTPLQIGSDNDWDAISSGFNHQLALKTDGTLWAWGINWYGQLGDGTLENKTEPIQIGSDHDWAAMAVGDSHSVAIRADGSLWAWGSNDNGQLGDGTIESKAEPIRIGNDNDWRAVAAGSSHTMALKSDGSLWAWGQNWWGQLGGGAEEGEQTPTPIGSANDWVKVFANNAQSMAIKSDGTLWIWGTVGSAESIASPTQIGSDSNWTSAAIGTWHTLALKSDGSLWGWGDNNSGQLGDGTTERRNVPTRIASENIWKAVAVGSMHAVALTDQTDSNSEIDECFIATAAFGSKLAPAVKILRQFRDLYLLTNIPGQALVKIYYTYSPSLAQVIAGNDALKLMVRILLLPLIFLAWMMMNTTATFVIMLTLAALVLVRRQMRKAE